MSELTDSLEVALEVLQADRSTEKRIQSTGSFIAQLELLYDDIDKDTADDADKAYELYQQWKTSQHAFLKTKNSALVRFGKSLNNIEGFSLSDVYLHPLEKTNTNNKIINNLIKLHLIRNGNVGTFSNEIDSSVLEGFSEMNAIEKDILKGDLHLAIKWCQENLPLNSPLLYQLHEQEYHQILHQDKIKAFKYARSSIRPFINDETLPPISKLVFSLIQSPEINPSDELTTQYTARHNELHQLAKLFTQSFSHHLGFPGASALESLILASHLAFPTLLKFQQLQKQRNLNWSTENELPFEVKLPSFLRFHPVFICPVSKEETGAAGNEAYGLPCGHVLSKVSVERLSEKSSSGGRTYGTGGKFKCPYCPNIASTSECREVRFYWV